MEKGQFREFGLKKGQNKKKKRKGPDVESIQWQKKLFPSKEGEIGEKHRKTPSTTNKNMTGDSVTENWGSNAQNVEVAARGVANLNSLARENGLPEKRKPNTAK